MMNSSQSAVYLFAGDSLTEGAFGESFVERIRRTLTLGQVGLWGQTVNAGRGGDTVRSLRGRIEGVVRESKPQWVVLAVGTNDAWFQWLGSSSLGWWLWLRYRQMRTGQVPTGDLDRFAAAYRALIDRVRTAGAAHVLVCTVSPLGEDLSSPLNHRVAAMNGVIQRLAVDCQAPVADVWQAFVDDLASLSDSSSYLPQFLWSGARDARRLKSTTPDDMARRRRLRVTFDGIHLNCRGADLWAAAILRALVWAREASE